MRTTEILARELEERLRTTWPEASLDEIVCIAPIGSRGDMLIYWRTRGRVTTGRVGQNACFEGSLTEFADKVELDYGRRLLPGEYLNYQARQETLRHLADYRAAIGFLATLPNDLVRLDAASGE